MLNSIHLRVPGLVKNSFTCILHKSNFHHTVSTFATVFDLYTDWSAKFKDAKIPEPEESSGYIAAHLLACKTHLMRPASEVEKDLFNKMGYQRMQRMPIQYILGDWDFAGINLKMRPPVFIPRPETEVLEIGCGTGAITLSLLNTYKNHSVQFVAIDAADHAIDLTNENAQYLDLCNPDKLVVIKHKVGLDDDDTLLNLGSFDLIVSNPPYIPTSDMESLASEISRYEDTNALHGGADGLDVVKTIIETSSNILTDDGALWLEVDSTHPALIKAMFSEWTVDCFRDMYNRSRFCRVVRTSRL